MTETDGNVWSADITNVFMLGVNGCLQHLT